MYFNIYKRSAYLSGYKYNKITKAKPGDEVFIRFEDTTESVASAKWSLGGHQEYIGVTISGATTYNIPCNQFFSWIVPEVATYAERTGSPSLPKTENTITINYGDRDEQLPFTTTFLINSYFTPTITGLTVIRCNSSGNVDPTEANNTYFKATLGNVSFAPCGVASEGSSVTNNYYQIYAKYTTSGNPVTEHTGNLRNTGAYSYVFGSGSINPVSPYSIEIWVKDAYSTESSHLSIKMTGKSVTVNMKPGGDGISIGKFFPDNESNLVDIAWDVNIDENITVMENASVGGDLDITGGVRIGGADLKVPGDYVVETGGVKYYELSTNVDGLHYWTCYRKWDSGLLENWYWFEIENEAFANTFGTGWYRTGKLANNSYGWAANFLGSTAEEVLEGGFPPVTITYSSYDGAPAWAWTVYTEDTSGTGLDDRYRYVPPFYLIRPNNSATTSGVVEIKATGVWKINE